MTTLVLPQIRETRSPTLDLLRSGLVTTGLCTLLAFLLLGYHPDAEDGGIYSAAIAARMDHTLFPLEHAWVEGHTHFALFVPFLASLLQTLHLPLATGLLLLQIGGLFATLSAVRLLAMRCFGDTRSAAMASLFFAVSAGLPVAGTSLYLFDPYVTARTFTTPLLLLATLLLLEERWLAAAVIVAAAAAFHPLMALWGSLTLAFLVADKMQHRRASALAVVLLSWITAAAFFMHAPSDQPLIHTLALGRGYWFLSEWQWYEVFGAVAPCVILVLLPMHAGIRDRFPKLKRLTRAVCLATATGLLLALCFARENAHTSLIARCQPLRALHLVFALFLVLSAGCLDRTLSSRRGRTIAILACLAMAFGTASMQRALYPASRHIELPGLESQNDWQNAFQWIHSNTDKAALFAIDADYIAAKGEDAHGFRAATLRSVLPDRAKDGGIASVVPRLAEDWRAGVAAQTGLATRLDAEHQHTLRVMGVTWIVVTASSRLQLPCPYRNVTVQVCRLND